MVVRRCGVVEWWFVMVLVVVFGCRQKFSQIRVVVVGWLSSWVGREERWPVVAVVIVCRACVCGRMGGVPN